MSTHRRQSGLTTIELVITLTLVTIAAATVITSTRSGQGAFERNVANGTMDSKSARAINRILTELLGAGSTQLDPAPFPESPFSSPAIEFKTVADWAGGAIVWSPTTRIALELVDGEVSNDLDDNDNGLIDEGRAVFIRNFGTANERRFVIANNVSEFLEGETPNGLDDNGNGLRDETGLCFDLAGKTLTVRLSVERIGPDGELLVRTLEAATALRN